jgi:hypothetical protein
MQHGGWAATHDHRTGQLAAALELQGFTLPQPPNSHANSQRAQLPSQHVRATPCTRTEVQPSILKTPHVLLLPRTPPYLPHPTSLEPHPTSLPPSNPTLPPSNPSLPYPSLPTPPTYHHLPLPTYPSLPTPPTFLPHQASAPGPHLQLPLLWPCPCWARPSHGLPSRQQPAPPSSCAPYPALGQPSFPAGPPPYFAAGAAPFPSHSECCVGLHHPLGLLGHTAVWALEWIRHKCASSCCAR